MPVKIKYCSFGRTGEMRYSGEELQAYIEKSCETNGMYRARKYKEKHVMRADVQSNLILKLTETNISRQTI